MDNKSNENEEKPDIKKERIYAKTLLYYSRKDVQEAIFNFCKKRETVPRYYEGFGKRPDTLEYPGDILQQVKRGATSFHCSEEIWSDPLKISTELRKEEFEELREGWDLLIDIDCKWFDYSRKAAKAIVTALQFHGIENLGIKYSGSKGFHIIVPFQAFPKEINGIETKKMFPEWPRIICEYLKEISRPILEKEILDSGNEYQKLSHLQGIKCESCGNMADAIKETTYYCERCRIEETTKTKDQLERKCGQCRKPMIKKNEKEFYSCSKCNLDSKKNPNNFSPSISLDIYSILGLDLVLVSSRHLFRCPYSLHEKTGFASIVIKPEMLDNFQPEDADPLKVKPVPFCPEPKEDEAKELLLQALDRHKKKNPLAPQQNFSERKFEEVHLDKTKMIFPPCINNILKGLKDGKKRALFILINYLNSLNFTKEEVEKILYEWNAKNDPPLRDGYIASQISYTFSNKKMLPPNCDKSHYKDILVCYPENLCSKIKNPVNYTIIKMKSNSREKPEKIKKEFKKKDGKKEKTN